MKLFNDLTAFVGSQDLLNAVLNNATVSLFVMDDKQHCVYMNAAAENLTGYTLDEVKSRPLHYFVHHTRPDGSEYPINECPIDQALPQNNREQGEEIFVHKNGSFYNVSFTASPIKNLEGTPIGTIIEVQEITEQKKSQLALQESLETLKTLNELGKVLSAELDLNKLVQSITDVATKICRAQFGALFYSVPNENGEAYTLYTISGVPREAFSRFPMPRNTHVFAPTFKGEGVVRSDDITKDPRYGKNAPYHGMPKGHLPVVSYLAVPVISRSGSVLGGLFFGHSAPGVFKKRDEDLLVGIAAQAAIAIDNAQLYKSAQESVAARDEFLSIASHELKTPLTSLKLQAQLHKRAILKNDPSAYSIENVDSIIDQTEKQVTRLTRLVDDMLDVSRIRSGRLKINREEVNLADLVEDVVKRISNQFKAASYEVPKVTLDKNAIGKWDKLRIEQVLINLLTNAIKYGAKKSIEIVVKAKAESVILSVKDSGIGIPKEMQNKIFDRFERAVSASEVSGLGLGLFITKQIVKAHGGNIWLESEPGAGSTFLVELPKLPLADKAESKEG